MRTLSLQASGQRRTLSRLLLQRLSRTPQHMLARCTSHQSSGSLQAFNRLAVNSPRRFFCITMSTIIDRQVSTMCRVQPGAF